MNFTDTLHFALHAPSPRTGYVPSCPPRASRWDPAVVLLTSIGDGIHRFVLAEFTQFGTNIINISPGKTSTHGASRWVPSAARAC